MIGIYKIQNKENKKCYIGQSIDIEGRLKTHIRNSFNQELHTYNYPLSRAIRKYGKENFTYNVIEICKIEELTIKEQYWIDYYNSKNNGYNQEDAVDSKKEENCNFAILTNSEVLEIIKLLQNTNLLMSYIGEVYSISGSAIEDINKGRRRVQDNIDYPIRKNAKSIAHQGEYQNTAILKTEDVYEIRRRYVNEELKEIFEDYKHIISFSGFKKVVYGVTWKHIPCYKKRDKKWISLE